MTPAPGADEPQGPGWWLASDGRYYPPELAPGAAESQADAAPPAAKKKVVKKKAPAQAPGENAPGDEASAAKKPAAKKKVVKKKAANPRARDLTPAGADLTDQRSGPMKFTAKAPASDQIAARRIQAKEQMAMLSEARQEAALRLLANLGVDQEPVLVGATARSFDARAERVLPAPAPPEPTITPEPTTEPDPEPEAAPEPTITEPVARTAPAPANPAFPAAPPVVPRAPAQAPPADPVAASPMASPAPAPPPVVTPPPIAPPPVVAPPIEPPPIAHRPQTPPEPSGSMGTNVPFMEVKGSALGTDIDRIGEKILIFADRVELHDRNHNVRQTIAYDELAEVEVQKKIMGPSLIITSTDGATMTAKALRPELATGAKAMIQKHAARYQRGEGVAARSSDTALPTDTAPRTDRAPEDAAEAAPTAEPTDDATDATASTMPPAAAGERTHKSVLAAMLDELHAAGILSAEEVDAKRSLIDPNER